MCASVLFLIFLCFVWQKLHNKSLWGWGEVQAIIASFIISAGWNWYHTPYRPHSRFVFISIATWLAVLAGYHIGKHIYGFLVRRFNRHAFWRENFFQSLDGLFFHLSLFFLVFFCRNQIAGVVLFFLALALLFRKTQQYLSGHPHAAWWKRVNMHMFTLVTFLFSFLIIVQYIAFRTANFDAYLKFHNIILFRAWAMSMFFMLGFSISTLLFALCKKPWRYFAVAIWVLLFFSLVLLWCVNIAIMYFTGLYFNPLMIEVARGSSSVIFNWLSLVLGCAALLVIVGFGVLTRRIFSTVHTDSFRQWVYYCLLIIPIALGSLFGLSSFKNTPEYVIVRNFIAYARHTNKTAEIDPVILQKLERFGLSYNTSTFAVARKDVIFSSDQNAKTITPNIIIVFFESFSSDLTSVYNKAFPNLTPYLEDMANNSTTFEFTNFFNASTPTINGIIAQLCSFLPPTGYSEIEENKNLQRLRLLCLPDILKQHGYATSYITAVKKEFENKNSIFKSMDTDYIYGQDELASVISGEPLSWGYSDHQLFPAMWKLVQQQKKEPFLMMLSTVDTHPPFDLARDMVKYGDGKNNVLNSYHTADDAFGIWWQQFTQSQYASNTIVIAVADHATFPGAEIKKLLPNRAGDLSFYDRNLFLMYIPPAFLSQIAPLQSMENRKIDTYASSIDVAPTVLHLLGVNATTSFEGHSIFAQRKQFPNVLGMHEYGLYINQETKSGRAVSYQIPSELSCDSNHGILTSSTPLTLCEYMQFYAWKRKMFEEGRFWEK